MHVVIVGKLMNHCDPPVWLHDGAAAHLEVTTGSDTQLGTQRTRPVAVGVHAIVEVITRALDDSRRQLGGRLDQPIIRQPDVAADFHQCADSRVAVVAFGAGSVAQTDF
ncbi:hypothetical protein D3C84_606960 [compost metagenome]